MQYKINEYLKQYPKSESFYQTFILPQLIEHKIKPEECRIDNKKQLYIRVKGVDILIFNKDNSVQILPHAAKMRLKCSYIEDHYQAFDVSTFLKSKHNKQYFVYVSYEDMHGYENELHNLVSQTIDFIKQLDDKDKPRKACIFQPKVIDETQSSFKKEDLVLNEKAKSKKYKKIDDDKLFFFAKKGSSQPRKLNITSVRYERNLTIAEYAKRIAKGVCQLCRNNAPFLDKDKNPYLETHHIVWLSNGGEDTIENTIALCPNCHKKMHIVNDRNDVKVLKDAIKKLVHSN